MNFDKLFSWTAGIVIACATVGQLDTLQNWVWRAQAKVIYESRSSQWGSLRFFVTPNTHSRPANRGLRLKTLTMCSHLATLRV